MAYTYDQLLKAWTDVHAGLTPNAAALANIQFVANANANGSWTAPQTLSNIVNSADDTTAVAVLTYQFFTGKSPTAAGLTYLVNSATNTSDLNDGYYAKFNLENRYINFAANLGLHGQGAADFANKYGAMDFDSYVASIYQTIIGRSYAEAASVNVDAAIAYLIGTRDAVLQTVREAGLVTADSTAAQVDLAVKAAMAGLVMAASIKSDIGLYAAAADNFMLAMMTGTAVYNTNITVTYAPSYTGTDAHGTGHAVDRGTNLPTAVTPTQPTQPVGVQLAFTAGVDHIIGASASETFTATDLTLGGGDTLDGRGGANTLNITTASNFYSAGPTIRNIQTVNVTSARNIGDLNTQGWTGLTTLNTTSRGDYLSTTSITADTTTDVNATVNSPSGSVFINDGHNVTLTLNGATGSNYIRAISNAADSAIDITRTSVGTGSTGVIEATGGQTIKITQINANAVNTNQTNADAGATGDAHTTSVEIVAPTAVAANGSTAGVTASTVEVNDFHTYNNTGLGTLATIKVDSYTTLYIRDNALTDLTLAHGSGNVTIDNNNTAVGAATALNLTVNGLTGGTIRDFGNYYTTLHITTGATASNLSGLNFFELTTLTVDGSSALNIGTQPLAHLSSVTVSGAAGLTAYLAGSTLVATVDANASTGDNTFTFSNSNVALTYTGGAGVDTIIVGGQRANTITVGTGLVADSVRIFSTGADVDTYTTITDAHAGLKIGFTATGAEAFNNTQVTGAFGSVRDGADAAIATLADGSTNGQFAWFQYNGDTYIVESTDTPHGAFTDGVDHIVKLTGAIDLSGSHASIVNHFLVLA